MLVSPSYHEISATHDSFRSNERKKSPEKEQQSCSETFRNSCSALSASTPLSAPPSSFDSFIPSKKNPLYEFKNCEKTAVSPSYESQLALEPLLCNEQASASAAEVTSCPNTFFYLETSRDSSNCSNEENEDVYNEETISPKSTLNIQQQQSSHSQSFTSHQKPLPPQPTLSRKTFNNVTDKEMRKKLKNRESAQAARDRKKAKMLSLEAQIKDLRQRHQILEADNVQLRAQVHKVFVNRGYWKNETPKVDGYTGDEPAAAHTYPVELSVPEAQNTYNPEKATAFNPTNEYQYAANLNEYSVLNQPITAVEEHINKEETNLSNFEQLKMDSNSFHSPSPYGQPLWPNDTCPPLPGSQHSTMPYSVASTSYDDPNVL